MEPKQVLIVILSILLVFVLLITGLLGVVKFYPELVGLPAPPVDSLELIKEQLPPPPPPEPKVTLNQYQLDSIQRELIKRSIDSNDKKILIENNKLLIDSINNINKMLIALNESINKANDSLGKKSAYSNKLTDSLTKLFSLYERAVNEISASKEKIKNVEKALEHKIDTLSQKNIETFAKIYNGTAPKDVAKILEQIDERDAAKILKLMQKKKASKVLEFMKPENSAAILLLGG